MFEGYLCVGGTEIGNNARARGYAESADCPVDWFVCDQCEGLADAVGDEGYVLANISEAPWFDPDDESTSRFYGAYIVSLGEVSSSTRFGNYTEGIVDGGVPGRSRHTGKTFRVRAWLTADGEDALETGQGWLDAALEANTCGTHSGGTCGASDATFFTACPPLRGLVPGFSPWVQEAENLFTNPNLVGTGGTVNIYENGFLNPNCMPGSGSVEVRRNLNPTPDWSQAFTGWSVANLTDEGAVSGGRKFSGTHANPNVNRDAGASFAVIPSIMQGWTVQVAPTSAPLTFINRIVLDGVNVRKTGITVQPGESAYIAHVFDSVVGESFRPVLEVSNPGGQAFEFTVFDGVTIEASSVVRPPFSPGLPSPDPDLTPSWTGAENASESVLTGVPVVNVTDGGGRIVVHSDHDGYSSARVISTVGPTSSNGAVLSNITPFITEGETYTFLATLHLDAPMSTSASTARRIFQLNGPQSEQAPNEPGDHVVRLVWTAGVSNSIRLGQGGPNDVVRWSHIAMVKGVYTGPWFDGDHPLDDPDFTTEWTGTANASTTLVTGEPVAGWTSSSRLVSIRSNRGGRDAMRVMRIAEDPPAAQIYQSQIASGDPVYTALLSIWRDNLVTPTGGSVADLERGSGAWEGGAIIRAEDLPPTGEWKDFSYTRALSTNNARLLVRPPSAVGESFWYSHPGLFAGEYDGPWFSGDTEDTDLERYRWTGAPNNSSSLYDTRDAIERMQTDEEYEATVAPLVRHMHDVICISGPLEIETRRSRDGIHWGRLVEFTLYAGKPWLYGETKQLDLSPTPATVVQDIPYNLILTPSAELPGDPVVVATNYSLNPSLEANATGWTVNFSSWSGDDPVSRSTSGRVTGELAAAGVASMRTRLLGNATAASGRAQHSVSQMVDITGRPNDARMSATIWGALINVGAATGTTLRRLHAHCDWYNASNVVIDSVLLGDIVDEGAFGGHVFSQKSMMPPAAATQALITVTGEFDWSSGTNKSDIRLYVDALALTVP